MNALVMHELWLQRMPERRRKAGTTSKNPTILRQLQGKKGLITYPRR